MLSALDRPPFPGLRWTGPDQWHVTLSFLGAVAEDDVGLVASGLAGLEAPSAQADLGPAVRRLGRGVLMVPVGGLDGLAAAVAKVVPAGPEAGRPFVGHVTLARAGRMAVVPATLAGVPMEARWTVGDVALVRSRLSPRGARYETVATVGLRN